MIAGLALASATGLTQAQATGVAASGVTAHGPATSAVAHGVAAYEVVADAIPAPLAGTPGNAQRGQAIVLGRNTGLCLLCHRSAPGAPAIDARLQGTLAPDLAGAGARWSAGQLRLRLVDPQKLNPDSIMPAYYRTAGLQQVGSAWRGKPLLDAQQIEDVVAYLVTLQ